MSDDAILAALGRLESRFDGLENRLARLEAGVAKMQGQIADLQDGQVQLREEFSTLRTDLTARMDRLERAQVQYRTDIMDRVDRLQNTLTSQKEAEIVTLGAGERAERIAKGASDEVRLLGEQITALTRLVRTLQNAVDELRGEH